MCGIAGFFGTGRREDLLKMTSRLSLRGPDAEGVFEMPGLFLGHRRLSIIDLEGGAQPMVSNDRRLAIVFNGEIYNHAELRSELQALGHQFVSDHSDTEVLLHGLREWGANLVSRLNGMWAFAIYDDKDKRLFLSRDRFGKKPLYYFHRKGTFAFASELSALLEHPDSPRNESEIARVKFFAHALIPAPHTPIEGVFKLPAAHNMSLDAGHAEPRITRYWRYKIEPASNFKSENDLAEELLETLTRATRRRLVSDVPLGVFLSGGLDSSAIAALATRELHPVKVKTFTMGFTEPTFDESGYAAVVADFLKTEHATEMLDLDSALRVLPDILNRLDEPQGDASLLPTWLLCRFARRHVTVALSGDGGDELFAGYDPFRALKMASIYSKFVPKPLHEGLRMLAARLPVSHANISLDFKIKRTLRGLSYPPAHWNPVWLGALEPSELAALTQSSFSIEEIFSEAIDAWDSCESRNPVDRTLQFYTEIYLQDGILAKADRASMMNSLEVRSPFLDIEVADFARRLPYKYKLHKGTTKYLLKRALEKILPPEIIHRRKKGFGSPVGRWLRDGRLGPEPQTPFIARKLNAHRSGLSDERLFLWCELVWQSVQKQWSHEH
jgi:asparagine synthase (glutamine-hydrolysing)